VGPEWRADGVVIDMRSTLVVQKALMPVEQNAEPSRSPRPQHQESSQGTQILAGHEAEAVLWTTATPATPGMELCSQELEE